METNAHVIRYKNNIMTTLAKVNDGTQVMKPV